MEFKDFLRKRRSELDISQAQLAAILNKRGLKVSKARIAHWEAGRTNPAWKDTEFRQTLAAALNLDVNDMMKQIGFVVTEENRSVEARRAAEIVDRLPQEIRSLAIQQFEVLESHYVTQAN